MSHFCRPKSRLTFRKQKLNPGNTVHAISYPNQALKWKMIRSMAAAITAAKQKESTK